MNKDTKGEKPETKSAFGFDDESTDTPSAPTDAAQITEARDNYEEVAKLRDRLGDEALTAELVRQHVREDRIPDALIATRAYINVDNAGVVSVDRLPLPSTYGADKVADDDLDLRWLVAKTKGDRTWKPCFKDAATLNAETIGAVTPDDAPGVVAGLTDRNGNVPGTTMPFANLSPEERIAAVRDLGTHRPTRLEVAERQAQAKGGEQNLPLHERLGLERERQAAHGKR